MGIAIDITYLSSQIAEEMPTVDFRDFDASTDLYKKMFEYGVVKKLQPGDVVLNEESYIKSIPIILEGSIKVMRTDEDGREILLYYIQGGESCVMSLLGGMHQDTSKVKAIVEDETQILFLPMDKVTELNKEHPEWLAYIFKQYHKRFEELLEMVNEVTFKKVDERLLNHLYKKAELAKSKVILTTHEQLANDLATSRVVVSRLLKQLEENGKVILLRNKIELM